MENKNYNINLNPKPLSDSQIAKHKDFGALLEQLPGQSPAPKPAGPRGLYYIAGAVAAALIGVVMYFSLAVEAPGMTTEEFLASQPYVNPPFENIQKTFVSKTINADQGGVYEHENGSRVVIPPAAFVDETGAAVSGEVDIKYREFHDYIDFFLSGIPMEYDSAGQRYYLESAGMLEVYAEQDGKRLGIAPDKKLDVELISEIRVPANNRAAIPSFNIYQLDQEKRNWVYEGKDQIEAIPDESLIFDPDGNPVPPEDIEYRIALADIDSKERRELATIESSLPRPQTPVRPVKANGSDFSFNFDFSGDEYLVGRDADNLERSVQEEQQALNQLRQQYNNTIWQVAPGNTDFNEALVSQIEWEDMQLRPINNRDYELTLIDGDNQVKVVVNPVLMGDDYQAALDEFNTQMAAYEVEMAAREERLKDQKQLLADRIASERAMIEKEYQDKIASYRERGLDKEATVLMVNQKIINRFQVSSLGIWNCDRPLPPFVYNLKGLLVENQSKQHYQDNTAFLVDRNKNTFCRFYNSSKADVRFDGTSDNLMWIVNDKNQLAVYRPEQFKEIEKREGDYTFIMDLIDQKIESEEDLREILQF